MLIALCCRHRRAFNSLFVRRRSSVSGGIASQGTSAKTIVLAMKMIAFLLLIACLSASASGNAQRITLSEKDALLEKIFAAIENQSGYSFIYTDRLLKEASKVTVNARNLTVEEAVALCLKDQPLTFTISDKFIVIKEKQGAEPSSFNEDSPKVELIDISGRITDDEGNPLSGATVAVRGSAIATKTNADGYFTLKSIDLGAVLEITFVGFEKKSMSVAAVQAAKTVELKRTESLLNEVVIKPYWKETKRMEIGNSVTVTAKDIEKQPVSNPILALQGRVTGMTILQANGITGGGITLRIQGRNNLESRLVGSDPFVVIDGVPYFTQNLSTFQGGIFDAPLLGSSSNDDFNSRPSFGSPLAFINPADIESITVLKDADATAIYGSRAANGAILITTKKGRNGRMKVNIDLQQGRGKVAKKMELLSSQQYMEMRREAKRNDGRPITNNDFDLRGVWDTTRYTDWQDELIGGTAQFTRVTAGVSGGTGNINYLISSTYGRETTVFPGDFANKFASLHFNMGMTSDNQRLKLQLGGSYMANVNKLPGQDYTGHALHLPPIAPALYNPDGSLNWQPDPVTGTSTWWNPLSFQEKLFETNTKNLVSNGSISYRIIPGLELKSTFGYTSTISDQFIAPLDGSEKPEFRETRLRSSTLSYNTALSWIVEPQLAFQQKWGNHGFSFLSGATFQYQNNDGRAFGPSGQTSDLLLRNMLSASNISVFNPDIAEYKYNAIFGRISYSLLDKYLFNLTARRDGSSRFGPESQFNNFGSVGAGWIISDEPFFQKSLPFISFAKIKGSYGTTGNDQIGNYRFLSLYQSSFSGIPYQGVGGFTSTSLPNPNLEWEETRKLQGGIDLGLLKDRLLLNANYFRNRSSNSLTTLSMPLSTGFNNYIANVPALIQNKGWELSVNSINLSAKSFRWVSNVNFTIHSNKLLAFPGLENSTLRNTYVIGQPLGGSKTYPFYGIDPLTGAYLVKNAHGDPTTNPATSDATVYLNTLPRWYGGLHNSLSFKGFSIDFLVQYTGQKGFDVLQLTNTPGVFIGTEPFFIYGNQPVEVMDRWQSVNVIGRFQRFSTGNPPGPSGNRAYVDLSFIRMKNASLGYQISDKLLKRIKMESLKLYINAQNLFTVTKYKGLDPESQSINSLPPLRMITAGIQATF